MKHPIVKLCTHAAFAASLFFVANQAFAGSKSPNNPITTAAPFLTIAPDSRSGGMGEVGAATTPDVWSLHWNAAKLAFAEKSLGLGLGYTPWLRNLGVTDVNIAYLTGYRKIDNKQAFAASLRYFGLGVVQLTDNDGNDLETYEPHELAVDFGYSRKLVPNFSMAIAGRYVRSDLFGPAIIDLQKAEAGNTFAVDVSAYYRKELATLIPNVPTLFTAGFAVSNLGAKIGYSSSGTKNFLPTNLRLGLGGLAKVDKFNEVGLYADANKLLVPTRNPDVSSKEDIPVIQGVFQSFSDAPDGFSEEMNEIQWSVGAEYWYDKQFGLRAGYFNEHDTKGGRQFFTLGLGLKYNVFGIDVAYLLPTDGDNSPLANTLRFGLTLDFDAFDKETDAELEKNTVN